MAIHPLLEPKINTAGGFVSDSTTGLPGPLAEVGTYQVPVSNADFPAMAYPHFAEKIFNVPLAITPAKAAEIMVALQGRLGVQTDQLVEQAQFDPFDEDEIRREFEVIDGQAIIPVEGTLVNGKLTARMQALSGLLSYQSLRERIEEAADLPGVNRILLAMNTGGGEVAGLFDFADWLDEFAAEFPIRTFISHMGASAGYVIAAATNEIIISQGGITGSVGTLMLVRDITLQDQMMGVQVIPIFAGARKVDGLEHISLTEQALAALQDRVDTFNMIMVGKVAEFRGMDAEVILATQAAVFIGEKALTAGFADAVGTFDSITQPQEGVRAMARAPKEGTGTPADVATLAELQERYPTLYQQLIDETLAEVMDEAKGLIASAEKEQAEGLAKAEEEARLAERARIKGIYDLAAKASLWSDFEACAFIEPVPVAEASATFYTSLLNKKEEHRAAFTADMVQPLNVPAVAGEGADTGETQAQESTDLASWVNERRAHGFISPSQKVA